MSVTIGRASLNDLYDLSVRGRRVSFKVDIEGSDIYGMQALRQQLAGLVDNRDEEVVPFTWSEDSSLDGFYRVVSVDVGSADLMLSNGFVPEVAVELEKVTGFSAPWFEVMTQSVVRTNGHGITTPASIVATWPVGLAWNPDIDLGPTLTSGASSFTRRVSDGSNITLRTYTAPLAATSYRYNVEPANFYVDACKIEVKYGSTWYPVVGVDAPRVSTWRISNGTVRLTANGSSAGTFEVWDNTAGAWESRDVIHWQNGSTYLPIGLTAPMTIARNSPEQVTVRVGTGTSVFALSWYYSLRRGARLVSGSWSSSSAQKYGFGFDSAHFAGATAITGGVRATSNDANGNRMVFGTAAANSSDLVNGATWYTTGATSGSAWIGVELDGSTASGGSTASDLVDQFIGAVQWRQRIIVR